MVFSCREGGLYRKPPKIMACPKRVRRPGKQAGYAITKSGMGELSIIFDRA
jgi:hypothetical protein